MYLEDSPILKQEKDLLNRSGFAKQLAKSLVEVKVDDGFCVGLFGAWGSGKSSIINMVREEIDNITGAMEDKPIVMYFNPWNFSSTDQLLKQYFLMLADRFSNETDNKLDEISKNIKKYAGMLDVAGNLIGVGGIINSFGQTMVKVIDEESVTNCNDIAKQRDLIIDKLKEENKKIIIIMDDIDRLSNYEIKLVFRLVNAVAKFPNTIYLLSFDKETVVRALAEVQNFDGERYLEKIVQVPIEIPKICGDSLWEVLFETLNKILAKNKNFIFEERYWQEVFEEIVSRYIENIRDVVRLGNILQLKCNIMGNDVNFVDLVAITLIEMKIPNLYKWIRNNKGKLFRDFRNNILLYGKSSDEITKINMADMGKIDSNRAKEFYEILSILFPSYVQKLGREIIADNVMIRKRRMGHIQMFDRYFMLGLEGSDIVKENFDNAVFNLTLNELENYIKEVNENRGIVNFLNELSGAIKEIKDESRLYILINALINQVHSFNECKNSHWLSMGVKNVALYKIEELFLAIKDNHNRYGVFNNILASCNIDNIGIISHLINSMELSYGRLAAKGEERGVKVLELEQLERIEKDFLGRILYLNKKYNLLDIQDAYMPLYLYKSFNKDSYDEYITDIVKQDINKLKYLQFSIRKVTGGNIYWDVEEAYKEYLTDDEILLSFKQCCADGSIWLLQNEQLHRVVAFVLWKEGKVNWQGYVEDVDVRRKIEEYKNRYKE